MHGDELLGNSLPPVCLVRNWQSWLKLLPVAPSSQIPSHFLLFSPYHFFLLDTDSHETRWKGRFEKWIQHPLWSVSNPDYPARNSVGHKNYGKYLVWLSSCFNGSILNSKTHVSCLKVQGQQQLRNSPGMPMSCWFPHFRVFAPPPCSFRQCGTWTTWSVPQAFNM